MNAALALLLTQLAGQIPLATEAELPSGEKVLLAADQLLYEPSEEKLTARGNTLLRTANVTVRADEVVYDQREQKAWAKGNVMFVSGLLAGVAEEVRVDIQSLEAHIVGGVFMRKRNVTEAQLLAARTPQELKKTGETVLTITGERIQRVGPNEFRVDGLSFTPCDCDPTEPSWRVEASRANVIMGEKATLTWPVIYVYRVPVLALPWLYVPLAERRTGLLVPRPNQSSINGWSFEQPIFFTLGESYDLTLTPGLFQGTDDAFGIRGGRLHTEFRYEPKVGMGGRFTAGFLWDTKARRNPIIPGELLGSGTRGLRGEFSWLHAQDLGNGWRARADVGAVSDGYYLRDVTTDVLARQAEYLRSTASVSRRTHDTWFGVDVVLRQPTWVDTQPWGYDLFREDRNAAGLRLHSPATFQRGPAVTLAVPERKVAGPVRGSFRVEALRLGPLTQRFGDEGSDGIAQAYDPLDPLQGNLRFDEGEREARERVDVNPRLSLPLALGRFAHVEPYLALRETLWLGERTLRTHHRGYGLVGSSAQTTLIGELGRRRNVRHAVTPYAEVRWAPKVLGGVPDGRTYDAVDAALPPEGILQAVTEVRQEFGLWQGGAYRELFRLTLGQGFDLQSRKVADTYAHFTLQQGPLSATGVARYDVPTGRWSQFSARLHADNGKGTSLFLSYDDLLSVGSDPLRAGIDALVGTPLSAFDQGTIGRAQQFHGGFRVLFPFGLGTRYEALVWPGAQGRQRFPQQTLGLSYGPGCDCWRLEVFAMLQPVALDKPDGQGFLGSNFLRPNVGANLTIHQFGHFGSGG